MFSVIAIESVGLVIIIVGLIRYYIHRKWQYLAKRNIPHTPPTIMKFGHLGDSFGEDMFTRENDRKKMFGPIWGAYAGIEPVIFIHDVDIIQQIYTKEFQNFPDRMKRMLTVNGKDMNQSLLVAKDKRWKRIRSTMSPTFSITKLKQMFGIFESCTNQTVAVLEKKCQENGGIFVPRHVLSNLSLDMIVSAALGTNANTQLLDGKDSKLVLEVRKLFMGGFNSIFALACFASAPFEWICSKLDISIFPHKSLVYVRNFTNAVIEERLKMKSESQRRMDLLQLLLDAELPNSEIKEDSVKGLSRDEIIGNAMLMIGAGFENTANTMVFLAYNLAFHPEVQTKLQNEIDKAFKDKDGFDYETVNNLKYLGMCLNESLRLNLPILVNSRITRNEITINGFTIPKDITVNIPTFALAHDPDYWEEPWEFRPERMEDMTQIDPMRFQPFGAGPRNCIGLRFAEIEIKLAFCQLLHKFTIVPCGSTPKPPLKMTFKLGVRPLEDFELKAVARE